MKWKVWLNSWYNIGLKLNVKFLELEMNLNNADKDAAWELYIELLTRIPTQTLKIEEFLLKKELKDERLYKRWKEDYKHIGDEKTALESIHSLFKTTRNVLKTYGRECIEFTKIAIIVLNQIVRPFTAKWHKLSLQGELDDEERRSSFREELSELQIKLKIYAKMLADIAEVEDLTELEDKKLRSKK